MRKVDTFAPHNDGHQWRKYGEKKINNTNFPRSERMSISLSCFVSSSFVPEKKSLRLPVFREIDLERQRIHLYQPAFFDFITPIHRTQIGRTVIYRQI